MAPSNAAAVALVDEWPQWPTYGAIICGPPGSGKTHLANVWQQRTQAPSCRAADLTIAAVPDLLVGNTLVIEDVDQGEVNEKAVFHALNVARQQGGHILLTGEKNPALWPVSLPDLVSRLKVLPVAAIELPDDALLRGVLVKLFADRQITVDEALVSYLLARMPRSPETARHLVAQIDALALEKRVEVTRALAGRVLNALENPTLI